MHKNKNVNGSIKQFPAPKKARRNEYKHMASGHVARNMEASQIGKFSTKGGTGYAAEDASVFEDRIRGRRVEDLGKLNAKHGPDRIVDGQKIQTKYYENAWTSVDRAFGADGNYRYGGMQLEVPSDQYEKALELMRKHISEGRVPGVTNPDDATAIIKKGYFTYKQARNLAKPGNIDSLKYDAKNGAVASTYAFAIGFVVAFAKATWDGKSSRQALKESVFAGAQSGATAFITTVITSQLLRTQSARTGTVLARKLLNPVSKTALGKAAIDRIAKASLGKAVYGVAAVNHVSKLLRSNVITGAVTVAVLTAPDVYRAWLSKNTSWAQVGKNLAVNVGGVAAGSVGFWGGFVLGGAAGTVVPIVGNAAGALIGGTIGAIAAGAGGTSASKYILDQFIVDDALEMFKIVEELLPVVADDYLMGKNEFDTFTGQAREVLTESFLRDMYAASDRKKFSSDMLEPLAQALAAKRPKVTPPTEDAVRKFIDELIAEALAAQEAEEAIDDGDVPQSDDAQREHQWDPDAKDPSSLKPPLPIFPPLRKRSVST